MQPTKTQRFLMGRARTGARLAARSLLWILPVLIGLFLCVTSPALVERLRNLVFDSYQRSSPRVWSPDLPVRIVDIDDASLEKLGQWPWPRSTLAELTNHLNASGAGAIVFDMVFAEKDRLAPSAMLEALPDAPGKQAYAQALQQLSTSEHSFEQALKNSNSVLGVALSSLAPSHAPPARAGFAALGDAPDPFLPAFPAAVVPLPDLLGAAKGLGAINYAPDSDLIVRKVPLAFRVTLPESALFPSLDAEALRVAQGASTILIKSSNASGQRAFGASTGVIEVKIGDVITATDADGAVRVRFAGHKPGRLLPACQVLAGKVDKSEIEGRIILIGTSAAGLKDLRSTPIDTSVGGVEVHAELLEHVLTGAKLARPDYALGLEAVVLFFGALIAYMLARHLRPSPAAVGALGLIGLSVGASYSAFRYADLMFDPLIPSLTWALTFIGTTIAVYRRTENERKSVREAFGRYLAPAMVERLAADPSSLRLGGEARTCSILFCDARNFTARSETLSAEGVVRFLNTMHTPLTQAILAERGTVDKYIGDGLMAFWNAPVDVPDHATRACRAALAIRRAIPQINAVLEAQARAEGRDHAPLDIGIGINTGDVFVGNMGSELRFDYSIVGDPVNVAARLETTTKTLGVPVLVSEHTRAAAQNFVFLDMGTISLKGKSQNTRVYMLHAERSAEAEAFETLHARVIHAQAHDPVRLEPAVAALRDHPMAAPYLGFYEGLLGKARDVSN